jgi:[amino group carrier protein]-lysine/ornithine hydrolase
MDPVQLLTGLLSCYSPTGQEAAAVDYLVAQLRAAGLEAGVDEAGNAVAQCGQGDETLVLLGHIDTVSGEIPVTRYGDRLSGRGAVDAKGPLACFASAVAAVQSQLVGKRVVVIGAVGEEGDSRGAHFIKNRYRPAATIIGEPSSWERITLGYKGSAWFDYRVRRSLAHTAAQAESACEAAVSFWNRVTAWAAERNLGTSRVFEQVSPTLRGMDSEADGFTEHAGLRFGLRLPPGVGVAEAEAGLRALVTDAELTRIDGVPAYRAEKNTPLVRAFLAAIRATGGTPSFNVKTGTSDMNVVAPLWGTPILAYGPGDSALDHTPDEHILISEYLKAVDVLSHALIALAGPASA